MKRVAAAVLGLLVIAPAAQAGGFRSDHGTFGSSQGTFRSGGGLKPPEPPRPLAPLGPQAGEFKPWKPTMRVDSPRGGVNAYPAPSKPKGYIDIYREPKPRRPLF